MPDSTIPAHAGPYARAARAYRDAGWLGVIPVVGKDVNVPSGFTGHVDRWPTELDVGTWLVQRGEDNVALRVPGDVVGVDVDAYDGKKGLETFAFLEQNFGTFPPTWTSTSRTDGSAIRWYRVPHGLAWLGSLGINSGVEIIQTGHRYAVVWPSTHPITGREYRWYGPDGLVSARPPRPTELPELPPELVSALRKDGRFTAHRGSGHDGRDHRSDSVEFHDFEGNRVDPALVLTQGLPIGSQQNGLFSYVCSLRERRAHREEAIALGMQALQLLENRVDRDDWTPQHVTELVDRVWRTYPPGQTLEVDPELRALAERLAGASRGTRAPSAEVVESGPREVNATDMGNTARFVALHRDRVRYAADQESWYVWDGRRWAPDVTHRVLDLTKDVVDAIRAEALLETTDRDQRDRWLAWAHQSESLARRKATVEGARSEPALVAVADAFDRDPHLLVARNGTVDLRTGALRPSEPADLCARLAEVDFQPEAECPRWRAHVDFMCNGDPALVAYVRRAVGYTLTGDVGERNFFFLEGSGSNGKNAFIEPLLQVMGSYAQTASTALLTGGDDQHPTILADLLGARLVFVDETRATRQLNVERVKALTGSKWIHARHMKKDFFDFQARFKLWIAGNAQPPIKDPSDGVWTRLHRVLCLGKVADDRKIKGYGDLLYAEEASGILNWALQGLADWWQLGSLGVPASVRADVQAYRDEEDYERQFVDEHLQRTGDLDDVLDPGVIYRLYRRWAGDLGLQRDEIKNQVHLGRALTRVGLVERRTRQVGGRSVRLHVGVRWREGVNAFGLGAGDAL